MRGLHSRYAPVPTARLLYVKREAATPHSLTHLRPRRTLRAKTPPMRTKVAVLPEAAGRPGGTRCACSSVKHRIQMHHGKRKGWLSP